MTKPTWSEVKTRLSTLDKAVLLNIIRDLYQLNNDNKAFLASRLNVGQPEALAEPYKEAIRREFNPDRGYPGLRVGQARKALNNFKKINSDPIALIDMLTYYAEQGVACTNQYGDIDEAFYMSVESVYEEAIKLIRKTGSPEIAAAFRPRFEQMVRDASGIGWGFYDNLSDMFDNEYPQD